MRCSAKKDYSCLKSTDSDGECLISAGFSILSLSFIG